MTNNKSKIIIDHGSQSIKYGLDSDRTPKIFVSENPNSPIKYGQITDFNKLEYFWHQIFDKNPNVKSALVTEPVMNPKQNREKITEMMFESYNLEEFYLAVTSLLSFFTSGRTTGLSIDSGYGASYTVPVREGNIINHGVLRMDVAGEKLDDYLGEMLFVANFWKIEITPIVRLDKLLHHPQSGCFQLAHLE